MNNTQPPICSAADAVKRRSVRAAWRDELPQFRKIDPVRGSSFEFALFGEKGPLNQKHWRYGLMKKFRALIGFFRYNHGLPVGNSFCEPLHVWLNRIVSPNRAAENKKVVASGVKEEVMERAGSR